MKQKKVYIIYISKGIPNGNQSILYISIILVNMRPQIFIGIAKEIGKNRKKKKENNNTKTKCARIYRLLVYLDK